MPGLFSKVGCKIVIKGTRAVGTDPSQVVDAMGDAWDNLKD